MAPLNLSAMFQVYGVTYLPGCSVQDHGFQKGREMDYRGSMRMRPLSALALLLVFNCNRPGGAAKDGGGGAAGADVGGPDQVGVPSDAGSVCAADLVGRWSMVSVVCGGTDVTQDIHTNGGIADMRMEFSNTGSQCGLRNTVSGPTCAEVEEFDLLPGASGTFSMTSRGITSCQPAQCVFNAGDAPCIVGDRAGASTLTSMNLDGGNLVVTSQPPAGLCGGYGIATILTYVKS
jgi:hypothetical protein